ncbi:MAG: transcription antitermination factor NusB [Telmatospirillum sp.]|nr:transcription antitermination factor NusB [Telmatospirillum sp.]
MTANKGRKKSAVRRSTARLAAVQALYQSELTGQSPDRILDDFLTYGIGSRVLVPGAAADDYTETEEEHLLAEPDALLLAAIFRGALIRLDALDGMIAGALSGEWTVERLEAVLRSILRCGAFELADCPDVPVRVVISEYVDIAHAFYAGPEPGLVNAVLDRIAHVVRAQEMGDDVRSR